MQAELVEIAIEALEDAVSRLRQREEMLKTLSVQPDPSLSLVLGRSQETIARLSRVCEVFVAHKANPSTELSLDEYQLFSVNKAANEYIEKVEKTLVYFTQMGVSTTTITNFQNKIRSIHQMAFHVNRHH